MFDPSWNSAMHQIEQAERRKEIEARIKEIGRLQREPLPVTTWQILQDELRDIRRELDALGVDPKAARRTEIRRRLQVLADESIAASDVDFAAIGKESMALWTELDTLNRRTEIEALDQAVAAGKKTSQGHLLWTSRTCPNRGTPYHDGYGKCPICDGGLAICSLCGMAEIELDQPCPGKRKEQPT